MVLLVVTSSLNAQATQYFVNPVKGNDTAVGTQNEPLKTINEAARRVNSDTQPKATEIILTEGIYLLSSTVVIRNDKFSPNNRLQLKAEINPDDLNWSPQKMPVVITLVPLAPGTGGDEARGIDIEISHVTIEGIKFTGSPDYSYKNEKELRRSYPIWRDGKSMDDLVVTQCLFAGNADVLPLHVGVIANGFGLLIDHCVFFNCKNPVVYWKTNGTPGHGNAMRNCLVYACYFSGIWTTKDTDGNSFDFQNNIIVNCKTAWIRETGSKQEYKISNSIFSGNIQMAGFGSGPVSGTNESDLRFLKMENVKIDPLEGIKIEKDQSKRNYLQLVRGSLGSELNTGLFKNKN